MVDLHTHSNKSDGSMSPTELIIHAKKSGVSILALTDHDTTEGIEEALRTGDRYGIKVVPGVEISTVADTDTSSEIHILGYFNNNNYKCIEGMLKKIRLNRDIRNPLIIKKLQGLGIDITLDEVLSKVDKGITGRVHIAKTLVEKGYTNSIAKAFEMYLKEGSSAYVARKKLHISEGIKEILRCGGVPVLAHPVLLRYDFKELEKLIIELRSFGLMGIEAIYTDNSPEQTTKYMSIAEKYSLIITGGSDYHGTNKPDTKIGMGNGNLFIGDDIYKTLAEILNRSRI